MLRALVVAVVLVASTVGLALWGRAPDVPVLDHDMPETVDPLPAIAAPPRTIDELRARIAAVLEREGVPGAGIALVDRDGPIWIGGVGVADLETRVPVRADTVFRAASITKMIVGLGVMRLVEQGKLDLDRPLRELVPDAFENRWASASPITLAHVLEHTAGFDDMHPNEVFCEDDAMTPTAALAINPRARVARWRPGTRMAYSNVGYTLAARAIEVVTGEPFDVYLTREILRPLGMRGAEFRRTDAIAARLATGYVDRGRAARFRPIPHRAAGALLASPADLAALVRFWITRGRASRGPIVSPQGLDRIERTGTLPYAPLDADYGLGNGGDVAHPVRSRGHDGGLPGFWSALRYFPERGFGYVVMLDATYSLPAYVEIRQLVFAYLAARDGGGGVHASATTPIVPPEPPGAPFYRFASPRNALFGFLDRTLLGWHAERTPAGVHLDPLIGPALDLVPAAGGAYRHPSQSGSFVRFARTRAGRDVMIAPFLYAEAASESVARWKLRALVAALLLLQLAPLGAAGALLGAAVRRRRTRALGLWMWPALAGLTLQAIPRLLNAAAMDQVLGEANVFTVGLWLSTIAFAICAIAGAYTTFRWWIRPDRPPLIHRVLPTACAIAAVGLGLWLEVHGIIGLRIWAW